MLQIGDKVTLNSKCSDYEKYQGNIFEVRDIGTIGGTKVAWLRGLTGCYSVNELNLESKLIYRKTEVAAKISNGKITEMKIPAAEIKNGEIVEMNV